MPQKAGMEKCVWSTAGGRTFLRPEGRAPGRGLPRYFGIRVEATLILSAGRLHRTAANGFTLPGIPMTELARDQKDLVRKVMADLLPRSARPTATRR